LDIARGFRDGALGERWRSVRPVAREWPVLFHDAQGVARSGSIDLILEAEDNGSLIVVDFKTDRESDEDALRAMHGTQIQRYAMGLRDALSFEEMPRCELWSLRRGLSVMLD